MKSWQCFGPIFVKHGYIFKQVQGVPMGGNASPHIADLTLSIVENRFLRTNPGIRLHTDEILITNYANFTEIASNIYELSPAT
ncbi:unnamed protein product [Gongylonema pulchrum]|uniref:Reverse transcriptase domain-containing protein n=1 Tax=Gongylonema pulchrum TaxID=637853 RepID=A0A183E1V4_9BILA|nr:unnamed protein product [Gongylonema pulchrum]